MVRLSELIAPSFYNVHHSIKKRECTEYWFKGGRGSTKSSFVSLEIISGIMQDSYANGVAFRKIKDTLRDSVYAQLEWAIDKLGVASYWECTTSPMQMKYLPTGQVIKFRGLDNPRKTKSLKVKKGYFKYIWFEELDEFNGGEDIRTALQSVERGGAPFVFMTYNPPKAVRNWVNIEVDNKVPYRYTHHSTYLEVPAEWLGIGFIARAEQLKKTHPEAYKHEYLGVVTGTGGTVFNNLTIHEILEEDIARFDKVAAGIDWGYASDPFCWIKSYYDSTRNRLFIFDEIFKVGLSNAKASELIKACDKDNALIICDSAEPKSRAEFLKYGHRIRGAKKGPDSIEYGIKFMQSMDEIVIDNIRCPNTAREFLNYELEADGLGGFKAEYPDKNNHTIDATRYRLEEPMNMRCRGKATIR